MKKNYLTLLALFLVGSLVAQERYALGTTTAIWGHPSLEQLTQAKTEGIEYVEIAINKYYRDKNLPQDSIPSKLQALKELLDQAGIKVWSIHLPFSRTLDISVLDDSLRRANVALQQKVIGWCARFNPQRLVLHGSSEPIEPDARAGRKELAIGSIKQLNSAAQEIGAVLCVENLPRTCLGNTPEELFSMVHNIEGVKVCFDTNHYISQEAPTGIIAHYFALLGPNIATMHVSDFDWVNESHWLPGDGVIDWKAYLGLLQAHNYQGVFMYEATKRKDPSVKGLSAQEVVASYKKIQQ